jgi:uncharacterized protein
VIVPRHTTTPFPPYSYVPGRFPHPHTDPTGHRFGHDTSDTDPFLLGVDLFNHGYYWEAHEAWETGWHASGRHGPTADFFKALIQLAVAGVKVRQAMPDSAAAHAQRAADLLRDVQRDVAQPRFMGLDLEPLAQEADRLAHRPPDAPTGELAPVEVVFAFALVKDDTVTR